MLKQIKETVDFIQERITTQPSVGIVLGTGLGGLIHAIEIEHTIDYKEIPNFPVSTVEGHKGQLIFGKLGNKNIMAMQGRFHYYEGYTMQELTFPIRVMKFMGIDQLILSNAAGGLDPEMEVGDLMFITDHINLLPSNPLIGPNQNQMGPRFPDMSDAYCANMLNKATKIARKHSIKYRTGVYAAVSGPAFETPAEYRYLRIIGADAVGMSTIPEVMVARHMGMTCFAISVISDLGVPGQIVEISHEDVMDAAANVEPKLTTIIREMLNSIE